MWHQSEVSLSDVAIDFYADCHLQVQVRADLNYMLDDDTLLLIISLSLINTICYCRGRCWQDSHC